jgi:hypothetical protein
MSNVQGILAGIQVGEMPTEIQLEGLGSQELVDLMGELGVVARTRPGVAAQARQTATAAARALQKKAVQGKRSGSAIREKHDDTAKTKLENRIHLIADEKIRKGLETGELTAVDHEIYVIKAADGTYTEMITEADDKKTGLSNLVKGQLPSGTAMLVTHVALMEGTGASPAAVDFGVISANTRNGEYSFSASQKTLGDTCSTEAFYGTPSDEYVSYHRLECPVLIQNATDIKFNLKTPGAPAADTCYKLLLRGVITARA